MRQYVLSVICAALICGIVLSFVKEGSIRAVVKLLCGAFLAVTVTAPLAHVDLRFRLPDSADPGGLTAAGENMARKSMAAIIKSSTETYILDKATPLQKGLQVEVSLSEDQPPVPVAVSLAGRVSPSAKSRIEDMIQTDLGIPKENLRWTG